MHLEILDLIDEVFSVGVGCRVRVRGLPEVVERLQHDRVREQAGAPLDRLGGVPSSEYIGCRK